MKYPTLEEINSAEQYQICKWYRFLPIASDDDELLLMNRIVERFKELGGMTPEISKSLGW